MSLHSKDNNWINALETLTALVDADTMNIVAENQNFGTMFPAEIAGENRLGARIPVLNIDRARKRLGRGRAFAFEAEVGEGARVRTINFTLKALNKHEESRDESKLPKHQTEGLLILEGADITKTKQAEYMLDSYSRLSEKNARDAKRERDRVEKLLLNIMPRSVYQEMKDFGVTTPQKFESASVLMLDFVGFTSMSVSQEPEALISELNDIFTAFDRIVEMFDCERIKTIGDAYMAVSGIPEPNADHAANLARAALRLRRYLKRRNSSHDIQWNARFGIATGPAIGSVVGIQKYVYDIFGPAVNLASRLEAFSSEMQITLSEETARRIEGDFTLQELGPQDIKGFGNQNLFELIGEPQELSLSAHQQLLAESRLLGKYPEFA